MIPWTFKKQIYFLTPCYCQILKVIARFNEHQVETKVSIYLRYHLKWTTHYGKTILFTAAWNFKIKTGDKNSICPLVITSEI